MDNNPNIDLDQLEEALLAAQDSNDVKEDVKEEIDLEFSDDLFEEYTEKKPEAEAKPEAEEEDYLKEILEEIPTLGQEGRNTYVDNSRRAAPAKRKENNLTLGLLLCAECLGIICLVLWWLGRLL